jgi:hypothetical protein
MNEHKTGQVAGIGMTLPGDAVKLATEAIE